ncbi:MAG TPA: RHS repeat-associated core domain-containing protein, partial [Streptosporangiaceae bacterium]
DPGQTTLFAGDTEIVVNTSVTPNALLGAVRTYAAGGTGAPIAVRSSLPGGSVDYLLGDPHGTATMAMDITTQAVSRKQYTPYGQTRGATSPAWPDLTHGYLAKPVDVGTGYADVGARKYDPALGRFISADPILETSAPQQLGGYTYAADNPVTGSDPSGLRACLDSCESSGGSGSGGSSSGSGNTDQGSSPADQCWGPGGNWICGTAYITVTPPGAGTPVTVNAGQPVFSDPKKTAQMVLDYRSIQGPSGYKGSSAFTYADALVWATTSEIGWEKFCGGVLGWSGNQCKADPFSGSKDTYNEAAGEYVIFTSVVQAVSCSTGVVPACAAATAASMLINTTTGLQTGKSGGSIAASDAFDMAAVFFQGLGVEKLIKNDESILKALPGQHEFTDTQQFVYNQSMRAPFSILDPGYSGVKYYDPTHMGQINPGDLPPVDPNFPIVEVTVRY